MVIKFGTRKVTESSPQCAETYTMLYGVMMSTILSFLEQSRMDWGVVSNSFPST